MVGARFDRWTRAIFSATSRRQALLALAIGIPGLAEARNKKRKNRNRNRKKIKRNEFGCVDVGDFCKNGDQCCSGVCKGKKGRKTCKAHDTGGCQPDQQEDDCGGVGEDVICTTTAGDLFGTCQKTTGNAGYCGSEVVCFSCTKDAECRQICGPDAACIRCEPSCSETGGTACAGPSECPGLED